MWLRFIAGVVLVSVLVVATRAEDDVEIVRDNWGVAHVFAPTEEALFYGAGFAMAEDRLLQMLLLRQEAEGRLAEILGPGQAAGGTGSGKSDREYLAFSNIQVAAGKRGRFVESDLTYRLLGFDRQARKELGQLQPDTRRKLEAFASGVNEFADQHPERYALLPCFSSDKPRRWEAADCLTVWARYAYRFTTGWESEIQSLREYERWLPTRQPGQSFPAAHFLRDDSTAIVPEQEFQRSQPEIYQRLKTLAEKSPPPLGWFREPPESVKASHNWVVSKQRSTTGKPILESNPQIPVGFPNLMYEIHLVGGRFDVRGITFPGTPGVFIGWNRHCAWGMTALGGDHADLFQERLDPQNSSRYLYQDSSRPFTQRVEKIAVKGREAIDLEVRETVHGPIVNAVLENLKEGEVFSLQHILLTSDHSSLEAMLSMMRATDWAAFCAGMRHFVAPAANLIFADDSGTIAYQAIVSTPKRRGLQPLPRKGWTGNDEWEILPFDELPSMVNPASQTIFTANHLPVGSWYPYIVSTSRGEGPRSWRLRELLAGQHKLSVQDFHETIHLDSTNPGVRDFVKLAAVVVREDSNLDPPVREALSVLDNWDGRLTTDRPGYALARAVLDVLLDQVRTDTPFRDQYGTGWNGVNGLVKDLTRQYRQTGTTPKDTEVRRWLRSGLLTAVQNKESIERHRPPIVHPLPYQSNLGNWGSLAGEHDRVSPPLTCPVTESIWSQAGESYVQIVDLADLDRSLSLMPPGVSENPASPHAADQVPLWVAGKMHPCAHHPSCRTGRKTLRATPHLASAVRSAKLFPINCTLNGPQDMNDQLSQRKF